MLTVHHLGVSQSERVVWLCEELGLDYDLQIHQRSPMLAPDSIRKLHPTGAAPIIQESDSNLTLAESAACVDWIIHKHGDGRLAIPPTHKDYATYLYWFHFANGTFQPGVARVFGMKSAGLEESNETLKRYSGKIDQWVGLMDEHLGSSAWLGGSEFSAADIMTVFTLTTMRVFCPVDLSGYGNVLAYLKKVSERPAYVKAREKGDSGLELMIDGPPPKSFFERK